MQTYLVGGAVRDKLLGLPVKDKDWVVVGSSKEDMLSRGYLQVGKGFPVFLHPETKQEYALARRESKTAPGHTGFDFDTSPQVTLEQDLQRRDLTINAMAENSDGQLRDPFNGKADLETRVLRHVSESFSEDPLRVLRVARFAASLHKLGFRVADETMLLMQSMVGDGELNYLVEERVWQEVERGMAAPSPAEFVRVLRECGALQVILPEVDYLFGVPQPEKYHPEIDTGIHTLLCLEQVAGLSHDPALRYAILIHDIGKTVTDRSKWPSHFGHETLGLKLQSEITRRLKVPNEYAQLAALVCEHHTKLHRVSQLKPKTLLRLLKSLDAIRRPERFDKFLLACEADARGRTGLEEENYPQRDFLLGILKAVCDIDVVTLLAANPAAQPEAIIETERLRIITAAKLELGDNG
ncbi:MAG: multifunctional CCA addition/repair protein [Gammaproteobacteria bacterium]|jgi:tRNA nucleotidyltransferase (CCA-adding enzyme)|nr:multifunctional CCA addition/repair protein [Gammaproteobacteria bacterium]